MARILDGKAAAVEVRSRVAEFAAEFARKTGRQPGLATVLVGECVDLGEWFDQRVANMNAGIPSSVSPTIAFIPGGR